MRKLLKNRKGFTLIELLAVIVILGILMIIAIPMVTRYIEQARRDTFVSTAKAYISGARYAYLNDDYGTIDSCAIGKTAIVPISLIDVDNAGKSPFGGTLGGYVTITAREETDFAGNPIYKYTYSVSIKDQNKTWAIDGVAEQELSRKSVEKTSKDITTPTNVTCP